MFTEHTAKSILAIACVDGGVTDCEKDALQLLLMGKRSDSLAVVKFKDAAKMLNLSVIEVKNLARKGRLKRVMGSGNRAIGVSRQSIERLAS